MVAPPRPWPCRPHIRRCVAVGPSAFDDAFWAELTTVFSPGQMVELAAHCAKWLGLGRLNAVMEISQSCPIRIPAGQG